MSSIGEPDHIGHSEETPPTRGIKRDPDALFVGGDEEENFSEDRGK